MASHPSPPSEPDRREQAGRSPEQRLELLQALQDLEADLTNEWRALAAPVPSKLRPYERAWRTTFQHEPLPSTEEALTAALAAAAPLVVGDFHSLRRARRELARVLKRLPADRPVGLLLELLPTDSVCPVADRACLESMRLVDGSALHEVYALPIDVLKQRDGVVAGAWTEGSPEERDRAAAERWQQLQREFPDTRWVLYFGDWHLADEHLPQALRAVGAEPLSLHQSPEPVWQRVNSVQETRVFRLAEQSQHWVWLLTRPLTSWVSLVQSQSEIEREPNAVYEESEQIIETLAIKLAEVLELPLPQIWPRVWAAGSWSEFRATLPAPDRELLASTPPPTTHIVHPHEPMIWFDRHPGLNAMLESAAHVLACGTPLAAGTDFRTRLCSRAFRRLWARHLNPFLAAAIPSDFPARLLPAQAFAVHELEHEPLLARFFGNDVPAEPLWLLAIEWLGTHLGAKLALDERIDREFVAEFLATGGRCLSSDDLIATIRSA